MLIQLHVFDFLTHPLLPALSKKATTLIESQINKDIFCLCEGLQFMLSPTWPCARQQSPGNIPHTTSHAPRMKLSRSTYIFRSWQMWRPSFCGSGSQGWWSTDGGDVCEKMIWLDYNVTQTLWWITHYLMWSAQMYCFGHCYYLDIYCKIVMKNAQDIQENVHFKDKFACLPYVLCMGCHCSGGLYCRYILLAVWETL